jgi:hypothetical protein
MEAETPLQSKLIEWDEQPLSHLHAFQLEDGLLEDLAGLGNTLGKKAILLYGDFEHSYRWQKVAQDFWP